MRVIYKIVYILLFLLPFSLHAETLRLLNWEAYLSNEVTEKWKTKTGHSIEEIHFDNDEKRDSILLNSKHHNIDIAVVDEIVAKRFGQDGRLVKLDENKLPNLKNIGPFWRERCSQYAVPYFWGTLGIIYRSDVVTEAPTSWKDILEPAPKLKGHIGMLNDYTDMLAPALFLNGHDLNTANTRELKQAFKTLKDQVSDVLTYEYPITFLQNSPQKNDLHMAVAYGGDQYTINEMLGQEGLWKYAVPEEGTVLWVDCLAITSGSQHKEEALNFINHLNEPKIAAKNSTALFFATPNEPAMSYLPNDFKNNKAIFPNVEILKKSGLYKLLSNENVKQRLRITNAITNIYESKQAR